MNTSAVKKPHLVIHRVLENSPKKKHMLIGLKFYKLHFFVVANALGEIENKFSAA